MDLTTITITVPADRVGEVYAFVATLHVAPPAAPEVTRETAPEPVERPEGLDDEAVRRSYLGGESNAWRPFLEALASRPDEWIAWRRLCEQIDRTPNQAAGMLGAAERRCKQHPPYEKAGWTEGDHWFRMPEHAAVIVRELAAAR